MSHMPSSPRRAVTPGFVVLIADATASLPSSHRPQQAAALHVRPSHAIPNKAQLLWVISCVLPHVGYAQRFISSVGERFSLQWSSHRLAYGWGTPT